MFELPSLPQEMGEIVIQGLRLARLLYRRLLNLTTIIAFLGLVPTVAQVWGKGDEVSFDMPSFTDWNAFSDWFRQFYGSYGITLLIIGALTLFPQIVLLRRIAAAVRGTKETRGEEMRQALRLWPWALLTAAMYLLVVALGLVVLVPGVILGISLMFSFYAVVLDGSRPLPALNASHNLVWGHWWRTLGLVFLFYVAFALLGMLLSSVFGLGLDAGQTVHARDLFKAAVLDMVLVAFLSPFVFCIQFLYYRDLKLRKQTA